MQVRLGKFEQCRRRAEPVFLQMNESARQLDQTFVKGIVRPLPACQPEFLQNIMRFVEQPLIEACKITEIMGVQILSVAILDQGGNFWALLAHTRRVTQPVVEKQ